jgi:hypothetical protein
MYHTLDPDSPAWVCVTCAATWSDALAFMTDPMDCLPAWAQRSIADQVAPIVWEGTSAAY